MSQPDDLRVSEDRLRLLRRVASGQATPLAEGMQGAVADGFVEMRDRRMPGGKVEPWPFITDLGLDAIRARRPGAPLPTFGKARNVLYVPAPLKERAAIIVDTHANGTANLLVFGTDPEDVRMTGLGEQIFCDSISSSRMVRFVANVPHSGDISKVGTWHWLGEGHTREAPRG